MLQLLPTLFFRSLWNAKENDLGYVWNQFYMICGNLILKNKTKQNYLSYIFSLIDWLIFKFTGACILPFSWWKMIKTIYKWSFVSILLSLSLVYLSHFCNTTIPLPPYIFGLTPPILIILVLDDRYESALFIDIKQVPVALHLTSQRRFNDVRVTEN